MYVRKICNTSTHNKINILFLLPERISKENNHTCRGDSADFSRYNDFSMSAPTIVPDEIKC